MTCLIAAPDMLPACCMLAVCVLCRPGAAPAFFLARPAALVFSVLLPAKPLLWLGFQHSTLVSSWRRYFNFSFVVEEKLNQDGRYIFAGVRASLT
jgi:hypothetical protein